MTRFKIAACQTPDIREDVAAALLWLKTSAETAQQEGACLVCFPECFLQGYLCDEVPARRHALELNSPAFKAVLQHLADLTPTLIFGMIESEGGSLFNTAVVVREGQLLGRYRKTNLLAGEAGVFSAGNEYPVFQAGGLTFGINICYDTQFAPAAAALAIRDAQLIVCPANNMMSRAKAMVYKDMHNLSRSERAQETGLWLISSDVTGESQDRLALGPTALINPAGQVVSQLPLGRPGLLMAEIGGLQAGGLALE